MSSADDVRYDSRTNSSIARRSSTPTAMTRRDPARPPITAGQRDRPDFWHPTRSGRPGHSARRSLKCAATLPKSAPLLQVRNRTRGAMRPSCSSPGPTAYVATCVMKTVTLWAAALRRAAIRLTALAAVIGCVRINHTTNATNRNPTSLLTAHHRSAPVEGSVDAYLYRADRARTGSRRYLILMA